MSETRCGCSCEPTTVTLSFPIWWPSDLLSRDAREIARLKAENDRLAERVADLIEERDRARAELADWKRVRPQPAIGFRDADGQYHEFVGPTEITILAH